MKERLNELVYQLRVRCMFAREWLEMLRRSRDEGGK